MNQSLLKAVEPYWIYDHEVAQKLDPDYSILKCLARDLKLIQLRVKNLSGDELFKQVEKYNELIKEQNSDCLVIMNDHIQLCQDLNLGGVHLGQSDASVVEAREVLGRDAFIGLTVRSLEEAHEAKILIENNCIDYVGVGTVFETTTKKGLSAKGPSFIEDVFALIEAERVYPIGGINKENINELRGIGVKHVALCSELYKCPRLELYHGVN
ncbi:thiamine phosphate synthase [Lentisphaera marina]|uniref:thiamine phosphate synthase n=1 Tax=Lentisphaera marina TaxID=1111041 RepID=UPI0023664258|nr:thiamine phosphate synthase [Lentisphaera marina]MDD7986235.1 thiamine phosphate synthase [Lentisphaera marina]